MGEQETVTAFYNALEYSDFVKAYSLLSTEFKSSHPYEAWLAGYKTTTSVVVLDVRTQLTGGVYVKVKAFDWTDTELLSRTFEGAWQLIRESGNWKLDSATIREIDRQGFPFATGGAGIKVPPNTPYYTPKPPTPTPVPIVVPRTIPYPGNGGGPTLCRDGSISGSSGRGTCSHHGGIAR